MKTTWICLLSILLLASCGATRPAEVNGLTNKEEKQGWTLLFNGKDFTGWRQYNGNSVPDNWTIEDGTMKVFKAPDARRGQGSGGDLIYFAKKFRNFELSIDWKTEKEANSGIFYNVREEKGKAIYSSAPEVQILDNENAGDNKIDSHLAGSLYDMLPANPKTVKPYGEWNTIVIRVDNGKVTHTQNGVKVVEYRLWTKDWDRMVENSKFKSFPGFQEGISKEGFIGLQDHGYTVWFRNVKIREL